jgi:thiol-disulfide isomerase/thioredoxin
MPGARRSLFDSTPLQTLDGETVTLAALSKDEPVLLYFWASWCGVCRFTTPEVARLRSEGENVMTIALRSGNEAEVAGCCVKAWISGHQ